MILGLALADLHFSGAQVLAAKKWRTYDNCQLVESSANDGDSFHMKYSRPGYSRKYFIRLYWVDCPESDDSIPERVTEQAQWWSISEADVLRFGKEAKKFTEKFLKDGFVVHSKLQDARGRSEKKRNYANVMVGDTFLAEALVANGLARIYGVEEMHEDGPSDSAFRLRLKGAEGEARKNRLGVWSVANTAEGPRRAWPETTARQASTPVEAVAPAPPTPIPPAPESPVVEVAGKIILTPQRVSVYSLRDGRYVGSLPPGHEVTMLGFESPTMIRVRFSLPPDRVIEAQCNRVDLGQ